MNANQPHEALPSTRPAHAHAIRRGTSITAVVLMMLASVGFMTATASADGCGPRIYYKSSHRGVSRTISYGHQHHYAPRSCGTRYHGYSYQDRQYHNGRSEGSRDGYNYGYEAGYRGRPSCNTEPHWVKYRPSAFRSGYHDSFHGAYNRGYQRGHHERYHKPCRTVRRYRHCH